MTSWDDREREFERRPGWTAFKWILGAVLLGLLLMVIMIPFGWGFAWLNEGARITGPDNSRDQFTNVIGDYKSLEALAGNACDAKDSGGAGSPTLVEGPGFAYRAKYRSVEADYDRRMANLFEAGIVRHYPGLSSYPRTAPTLKQMEAQVCG